ncbi:hypothetical protein [Methylobacterium sp. WL8]|uniref:hypothetical protein n=1 Tax=Methylobacterium sp. WL8 TaxID=2603899 RepID=UPI0011C91444|nr:hypothetical protein [Methylobacterium sp. WL8]TXN79293.1 hypothetical protein FV234_21035 [Methylobacterium sp. WL8]
MGWNFLISFVVGLINKWLATKRAEQALRDLGAATQAATSNAEAERREGVARAAGDAIGNTPVPANDPDMRDD